MAEPEFTTEELASEEWRPVVGYEGWYSVSNLGRVRREKPGPHTRPGLILNPPAGSRGYLKVSLHRGDTGRRTVNVHKLVAEAFIGPCPPGMEVNHLHGKTDNRACFLEYTDHAGNVEHSLETLGNRFSGERNGNAILTEPQVVEIRERAASGEAFAALAREFGIHDTQLKRIVVGMWWKHAGGPRTTKPRHRQKLTEADVKQIRAYLASGALTNVQIGALFGVTHGLISNIKRGLAWKHVPG